MTKNRRTFRTNSSGQLILVAALAIAMLISSTTIYVYELSKQTNNANVSSMSNFILAIKQATRNTMISSLVNISNGGEQASLTNNLNELSQILGSLNHYGLCKMDFALLNNSNYNEGVWLSWNTSGIGDSSAYANFTLKIYSTAENATVDYSFNMTTAITLSGYYTRLSGDEKQVNLTCRIYNEGKPALAKNLTTFYENSGNWTQANSSNNLSITDYGNGTYHISLNVTVTASTMQVSIGVLDLRNIFVQANATCYEA